MNKDQAGFVLLEAAGTTAQNLMVNTYSLPPFGIGIDASGNTIPYTVDLDPRTTEPDDFIDAVIASINERKGTDKLAGVTFAYAGMVTPPDATEATTAICVQIEFPGDPPFVAYRPFVFADNQFTFAFIQHDIDTNFVTNSNLHMLVTLCSLHISQGIEMCNKVYHHCL